jgi:transcriptional regulator with XRE-family HTH domain
MALNARLRAAREATSHKTAVTFADAIDIAANTVYRIEAGRMKPSIETLHRWARECGVTTDSLLDGLDTSDTVVTDDRDVKAEPESAAGAAQ